MKNLIFFIKMWVAGVASLASIVLTFMALVWTIKNYGFVFSIAFDVFMSFLAIVILPLTLGSFFYDPVKFLEKSDNAGN